MVTDAVLDWLFSLIDWMVNQVPSANLPFTLSLDWMGQMNYFIPITEMFGLFTLMFAFGGVFIPTSLIVWLLVGVIRGGNPKA